MKKLFSLNILLITHQLLLLSILFFGFTYANASNNANQVKQSPYDATNLKAAFSVLKMRIESERKSLEKLSIACNAMGTREQIKQRLKDMEERYEKIPLLSINFQEMLRKDKRDMAKLDIIQSQLRKIQQNSIKNMDTVCKATRENTPDLAIVEKAAKETQNAVKKAKKLISKMKEISSELYDSLSDSKSLLKKHYLDSASNIFDYDEPNKCLNLGVSFDRQVLLAMIPERYMEIKKRYKQAAKLLTQAKRNNYQHADIYQARYDDYKYILKKETMLHEKYLFCKDNHSYLSTECNKLYWGIRGRAIEKHRELTELLAGIWKLRKEQLSRLKASVKSMVKDKALIYAAALDADECMGNVDLNETIFTDTDEDPPVSPESCTCIGNPIEIGPYKNESDCLKDQKIWSGDLVTWSIKNGGTCYRCPEEDVDCEEKVDRNPESQKQPKQVNGTIWDVWGPIPYGHGTICLTGEEVSARMKSGAKKDKDGWFGRKGGGTMRSTGKSCTKTVDTRNTPGGSDLDPDKSESKDKQRNKQAEELRKKSRELWEQGKLDEAIKTAKKASQIVPKNTKIAKTHQAMQKQKKELDKRLKKVSEKIRKNRLKEAERILDGAERINDKYSEYKKARQALSDAKKKAREDEKRNKLAEELQKKAKDLWRRGDLSKAIVTIKKASQTMPNNTKIVKIHESMKSQKKIMDNALSQSNGLIGREEFKKAQFALSVDSINPTSTHSQYFLRR